MADDMLKIAREIVHANEWGAENCYDDAHSNLCSALTEEFAQALLSAVMRERESKWIKIEGEPDTSKAPWDGGPVHLGFAHMAKFDVIAHWSDGDWSLTGNGADAGRPKPTAWQPLPAPPRTAEDK